MEMVMQSNLPYLYNFPSSNTEFSPICDAKIHLDISVEETYSINQGL